MRSLLALIFIPFCVLGQPLAKAKKLFEEKKYNDARKILLTIPDDDTKVYAEAQYYLGRMAFNEGKDEEAEEFFETAVDANGGVAEYHYWYGSTMGRIAQNSNTFKQGILAPRVKSEFEKTVELDPRHIDAHWGLIEFYTQAPGFMGGSWENAEATAKGIIKIEKAEGHRALGIVYERQEKWRDAEAQFILAYQTNPSTMYNLANFYLRQKKFDKAFALFDEALKKNPDDMLAIYMIGRTSAVSGQKLEQGEQALLKYLTYQPKQNEPSRAGANMRLGQIKEKKGNKVDAKKLYETALKLDPNLKEAKEGLSRVK